MIGPHHDDAAALARARERLASELDRHYWRDCRGIVQSRANRYLSRVLQGPRALGPSLAPVDSRGAHSPAPRDEGSRLLTSGYPDIIDRLREL